MVDQIKANCTIRRFTRCVLRHAGAWAWNCAVEGIHLLGLTADLSGGGSHWKVMVGSKGRTHLPSLSALSGLPSFPLRRGRHSAAEWQLPTLHLVGSIPIAELTKTPFPGN